MTDPTGFQQPNSTANDFNSLSFVFEMLMSKVWVATLVRVQAVTNVDTLSPVGYVDILPMVMQIDGALNTVPHETIHHCPYFRMQGGTNAVILDPKVNDVGIAIFAHGDISVASSTGQQSPPGSRRRNDPADAMYIGGVLNGIPTQYILFAAAGISVVSPTKITLQAPEVDINSASVLVNGTSLKHNGVNVGSTHVHISSAPGDPTSVPQ